MRHGHNLPEQNCASQKNALDRHGVPWPQVAVQRQADRQLGLGTSPALCQEARWP